MLAAVCTAASEDWKEIPLDSCRKVPGLAESMMGVCLEGKTLYAIGGGTLYALDVSDPVSDPKNMKLRSLYDSVEFATGIDVAGKTACVDN